MRHPFLRTLAGTTTDPNFENVTLLLHGDGTNGGQNNTFVDGSTNNFTITRNGNTTQGTFSPYGDNWSNYFDGTGDYLTAPAGSSFAYGTGDFTVEGWFYATAEPVQYGSTLFSQTASGNNYFFLALGDDTANNPPARKIKFTFASTNVLSGSTTYNLHSWNHFALVRSSGSATVYLNGVGGTAVACTTDFNNTTFVPTIGRYTHTNANLYTGYLSNFRVLKGTAQYTANFTPPTAPLTSITNTSLLTCQSNRFRDASTNNFTITRNGDVSVQRFSPFSPTAAYAAGTIGGSGYFDGNLDSLTIADDAVFDLGNGAFTIEAWVYLNGNNNYGLILGQWGPANNNAYVLRQAGITYYPELVYTTNGTTEVVAVTGSTAFPLRRWVHVAAVRNGSSTISLFVDGSRVATNSSFTATIFNSTANVRVGGEAAGAAHTNGYICDARLVKGTAVYDPTQTTLTVPTAQLTAITNTSLLLNFTNAAIVDNAMMAVPETVGNAQISTSVKKYGTGSLYFDGTGDYIHCKYPAADVSAFGAGDFTVEFWLYTNAANTTYNVIDWRPTSTNGAYLAFYLDAGTPQVYFSTANKITGGAKIAGTTWTHVAICRSGSSMRLFIDGTQSGSTLTDTTSFLGSVDRPAVGGFGGFTNNPLNGYIDDLRVTKGVARYTANFTAPTAAFPDL